VAAARLPAAARLQKLPVAVATRAPGLAAAYPAAAAVAALLQGPAMSEGSSRVAPLVARQEQPAISEELGPQWPPTRPLRG